MAQPAVAESVSDSRNPARRSSAAILAARVVAARTELRWTLTELQSQTGLSARTLRDIEAGNPDRRYSPNTLAHLDHAFDWEPNTAWAIWRDLTTDDDSNGSEDPSEITALRRQVEELMRTPPWIAQLVEMVRSLSPEERRMTMDFIVLAPRIPGEDRRLYLELGERLASRRPATWG